MSLRPCKAVPRHAALPSTCSDKVGCLQRNKLLIHPHTTIATANADQTTGICPAQPQSSSLTKVFVCGMAAQTVLRSVQGAAGGLVPIRRALVSVFDKGGVTDVVKNLVALDVEIVSTGGTAATLRDAGVPVSEFRIADGPAKVC